MLLINLSRSLYCWFDSECPHFRVGSSSLRNWLTQDRPSAAPQLKNCRRSEDLRVWRGVWSGDELVELKCPDSRRAQVRLFEHVGAAVVHYIDLTSLIAGLLVPPELSQGFATIKDPRLRLLCLLESYLGHAEFDVFRDTPVSTLVSADGRLSIRLDQQQQIVEVEYTVLGEPSLQQQWPEQQCPVWPVLLGLLHGEPTRPGDPADFQLWRNPLLGDTANGEDWAAFIESRTPIERHAASGQGITPPSRRIRRPSTLYLESLRPIAGLDIRRVVARESLARFGHPADATFAIATVLTRDGLALPALVCPQPEGTTALRQGRHLLKSLRLLPHCGLSRTRRLGDFVHALISVPMLDPQLQTPLQTHPFALKLMQEQAQQWLLPREMPTALKQRLTAVRFAALVRAVTSQDVFIRDALLHSSLLGELLVRMPQTMSALRRAPPLRQVAIEHLGVSLRSLKTLDAALSPGQLELVLTLFPPDTYWEVIQFLVALTAEEAEELFNGDVLSGLAHFVVTLRSQPVSHWPPELSEDSVGEGKMAALWRWVGRTSNGHKALLRGFGWYRTLPDGSLTLDMSFQVGESLFAWWARLRTQLQHPVHFFKRLQLGMQTGPTGSPDLIPQAGRSRQFGSIAVSELHSDKEIDLVGKHMQFCLRASYHRKDREAGRSRLFLMVDSGDHPDVAVLEIHRPCFEHPWTIIDLKGFQNQRPPPAFRNTAEQLIHQLKLPPAKAPSGIILPWRARK